MVQHSQERLFPEYENCVFVNVLHIDQVNHDDNFGHSCASLLHLHLSR